MPCEGRGKAFVIHSRVADDPEAETLDRRFEESLGDPNSGLCQHLAATIEPAGVEPSDFIFMDIETTGLSNSPLFLIGAMVWADGGFEVRQFLARDYSEEAAVNSFFIKLCQPKKLLVTFNGKSFDMPYIRSRAAVNGVPFALSPAHFDLLHVSRRIWRGMLPNCKLQTLEQHICRRRRFGDIPGSQIPDAYHAFVHSRNARQIVEILRHNLLDLVTLADLMTHLPPA